MSLLYIILSCSTSLDSSKPIQREFLHTTRASAHLLLHSRNNSSRYVDAYAKGNTLQNNKNSQARSHIS